MLCLAFACLSLQRTRCLQELICHNGKEIRSVHRAAVIDIYAGLENVIAVKAQRSTHGGMIWSCRVSGSWRAPLPSPVELSLAGVWGGKQ
jgi:hypothetical protein